MADQKISLCIIAKSGRELFEACLQSIVPYVDETIVVIDGDSPDGCDDLARNFGAKVFYREMAGDFAAQRNFSFEQATGDWYFWMDSDDIIPPECASMLHSLAEKGAKKDIGVFLFDYHYAFDEHGRPNTILKRERLMRADLPWKWRYEIHEVCVCDRPEGQPDAVFEPGVWIVHRKHEVPERFRDPERNLRFIERIMPKYEAEGDVRMLFYAGNEFMSASRFEEAEHYYSRLIDMEGEWGEQRVLAAVRLAQIRFIQERFDDAEKLCFRAIEIDHHWADPYCMLGDLSMMKGKWDRAIHFFDIAANMPIPTGKVLLPYDPARFTWYPRYRKHLALAETGRYLEALQVIRDLIEHYMPANDELASRAADLTDLVIQNRRKGLEGVVAVQGGLAAGHPCNLRQRALADGLATVGVEFEVIDEVTPSKLGGKLCVMFDSSLRASPETITSIRETRTDVVFDFCGSPQDLSEERLVETMKAASAVTTNSPFLLEQIRSINPRTYYLPDPVLPGCTYVGPRPERDHLRFLIVTTSRKDAGAKIIPLIEAEARKLGKKWAIKVFGVDEFSSEMYTDDSFARAAAESDIGICYFHRDDEWHGAEFLPSMMASGLPVVASGNSAVNDVIDHKRTGFVCYHADEWRQALTTLISEPETREKMGKRAALKARRYDSLSYVDRWSDAGSVRVDRLDVVIPVHSQVRHVSQCVTSILDNCMPTTRPILVVNPTSPEDVEATVDIALSHPLATMLEQSWIRNFAANCNAGVRLATGSMVSLLNSDTIVTEGWDRESLKTIMENGPGIVAAYSNGEWGWRHTDDLHIGEGDTVLPLRQEHEWEEIEPRVGEIYDLGRRIQQENSGRFDVVDWVTFAAVTMPRTIFLEVGDIDDRFQNDSEDFDFCRRVRKFGGRCYYSKAAFVFHYCGVSRDAVDGGMNTPRRQMMLDRNKLLMNTKIRRENRTIKFYLGKSWEPWLPENVDSTGIGGSETCVVNAARCLAQLGWHVEVYATEDRHPCFRDGVTYYHYEMFDPSEPCDVAFIVRKPEVFDHEINAKIKVLYMHDATYGDAGSLQYPSPERVERMDHIFVLSDWHRETMKEQYPHIPDEKFFVTTNGIDMRRFDRGMRGFIRKDPKRFVYSSSGDRGLETLLSMWPRIYQCDPDYRLHLYYGMETWKKIAEARGDQKAIERMERIVKMSQHPGIVTHGRVGQARLAEEMAASNLWLYPTWFTETSCCLPGTMIRTKSGQVPIEEIVVGDEVLTHDGSYRRVTDTKSRHFDGSVYGFKVKKTPWDLWLTGEHPLLTCHFENGCGNRTHLQAKHAANDVWNNPNVKISWTPAERMTVDKRTWLFYPRAVDDRDVNFSLDTSHTLRSMSRYSSTDQMRVRENTLHFPKVKSPDLPRHILLNHWLGSVIGRYIAEGDYGETGGQVTFAFNSYERDAAIRIGECIKNIWGVESSIAESDGQWITLVVSCRVLGRLLSDWCGKGARQKHIPEFSWNAPAEFQVAMLADMIGGDGSIDEERELVTYTTTSDRLAFELNDMILELGGDAPGWHFDEHRHSHELAWAFGSCPLLDDVLALPARSRKRKLTSIPVETGVLKRIQSIDTKHYSGPVYNLEVEGTESYVANGVAVHNCITAMETMVSGMRGITTPLAALTETASYSRFVEGDCTTPEYQSKFMEEMLKELLEPDFVVRNAAIRSTVQTYDWRKVVSVWDAMLLPELIHIETPSLPNSFSESDGMRVHFVMPFGGSGGVQYPIELAAELDRVDGVETRCTLVKFQGEDFDLMPLLPAHPRISIVNFDEFRSAADDVFACDHVVATNWQTFRLLRDMGADRRVDLKRHVMIQGDERSWAPLDQISAMMSDASWQKVYVSEHLRVALQAPGRVVPDGVNIDAFTPGPDAPDRDEGLIGCIIHPSSEIKNTDIVLAAAAEMGDGCRLLSVVAAPELEGDEKISSASSEVIWGPVSRSEIAEAMSRCGAWLVPSTEEGFGIVGLEAMLSGCILITAAPGGMKTYVRPDENALRIFNPRSKADWINMMNAYLHADPGDVAEMRRRARATAEAFSISRSAATFIDAIVGGD